MENRKILWIIEQDMFDYDKELILHINKNGDNCILYDYNDSSKNDKEHINSIYKKILPLTRTWDASEIPVIAHGSIRFIKMINKSNLIPGTFANFDNFKCSYYYPLNMNIQFTNRDFIMLPFGSIIDKLGNIIKSFQINSFDESIFIRPDDGSKSFTGRNICLRDLNPELKTIKKLDCVYHNEMCLISHGKELTQEYRFLIIDGEVVSGSMYKDKGELCIKEVEPNDEIWEYAMDYAMDINFSDPVYMLDLCYVKSGAFGYESETCEVVELNSFSSADFYNMDLEKIVKSIKNKVIEEWDNIFKI